MKAVLHLKFIILYIIFGFLCIFTTATLTTELIGEAEDQVPHISESVSIDAEGNILITLGNLSTEAADTVTVQFMDKKVSQVQARILTGTMAAHNTFDEPECVKEEDFTDYRITEDGDLAVELPACSVVQIEIRA